MAMLFITHDLGIVRKFADRVCVMKDGEIVEQGTNRRDLRQSAAPYTKHLLAAEPKGEPPRRRHPRPRVMQTDDLKVWFPIKRGFLRRTVGHVKAVDGRSSRCAPARRWRRRRIRLGQDHAGPGADAADPQRRPRSFHGPLDIERRKSRCARCGARCRWCSRTRSARSARACRSPRSSAEGLLSTPGIFPREDRDRAGAAALEEVGLDPRRAGPLSARVFRRPAPAHRHRPRHGAASRNSWCWTSRPRRST
jgi:hypothetical protein